MKAQDIVRALGVALQQMEGGSQAREPKPAAVQVETARGFCVLVRGKDEPPAEGEVFEDDDPVKAFDAALAHTAHDRPEPLISWEGKDRLCVIDLDAHDGPLSMSHYDIMHTFGVKPAPARWWASHGGGLKLVYAAHGDLTAEDLAAVGRYTLRRMRTGANAVSLHSHTRHPLYPRGEQRCGKVHVNYPYDADGLGKVRQELLGDYSRDTAEDDAARDSWLEENGLTIGQRLPHDRCLIQPTDTCASNPVEVRGRGVKCFRCEDKGLCYSGLRTPGYVPYGVLTGARPARVRNDLRAAVRGMVHWPHARAFIDGDEAAYLAFLKMWHLHRDLAKGDRPEVERLIGRVFYPPVRLVRVGRGWAKPDLTPRSQRGLDDLLRSLPAARFVEGGKAKINGQALGDLKGDDDLSDIGYRSLTPIRGVDIVARVRPQDDEDNRPVFAVAPASPPFAYRPPAERGQIRADYWIERCYPGINLRLLRLIVAMKGFAQLGTLIDTPQLFVVGQSRAGKSVTVRLGALIACDAVTEMRFSPDQERFLQGYGDASEAGAYALYNEAGKAGVSGSQLRDYCLMFVRGVSRHKLYEGQRPVLNPAAVIMTEPVVPRELLLDEQTARRIAVADLGEGASGAKDWKLTCGTDSVDRWRRSDGYGFHDQCDAFLSDVVDRYFTQRGWTFERVVADCGFAMLETQCQDQRAELLRFYELATAWEEFKGSSRWRGPGWRVFPRDGAGDLPTLYRELSDNGKNLQLFSATHWWKVTGVSGLRCTVTPHHGQVGVRFETAAVATSATTCDQRCDQQKDVAA